ncbi:MAG: hypothetical protein ACYC5K_07190, partial [Saccharofermentanales bacterium]
MSRMFVGRLMGNQPENRWMMMKMECDDTMSTDAVQLKKEHRMRKRRQAWRDYKGYVFLMPFIVLFLIFTVIPLLSSFTLSLFQFNGL